MGLPVDIDPADMDRLMELGLSRYEVSCYLALVGHHPANGSQLSRLSGIARSRIYDVLRSLVRKQMAMEVEQGQYVPLPADELVARMRQRFDRGIQTLRRLLERSRNTAAYEFIWTLKGYDTVMAKARQMIVSARREIYARLFPQAGRQLEAELKAAETRGVAIRYIAMGPPPPSFEIQVVHPNWQRLEQTIGGRSFDLITDRSEALVGIFDSHRPDGSPINWTRNPWFVIANRDSLRHDFYHYFLEKTYDQGKPLDAREQRIYDIIKADD